MSYPAFKDFDKSLLDVFTEDFKTEYAFKAKAKAPQNLTFTSTSTFGFGEKKSCAGKLGVKWVHPSGFSLEKLEIGADGKITTETALEGAAPGLKLEFKGNDSDKGDLSFSYKIPSATITGEVDAIHFQRANVSVFGGLNDISAGAAVDLKFSKSEPSTHVLNFGAKYGGVKNLDLALFSSNTFKNHRGLVSFKANDKVTVASKVESNEGKINASVATIYGCNANTTIKVKVDKSGETLGAAASVKQTIEKGFTVTGIAQVPNLSSFSFSGIKWGVNAQLG